MQACFNHSIQSASATTDGFDSVCIRQVTQLLQVIFTCFLQVLSNVILTVRAKPDDLTYLNNAQSMLLHGYTAS